MNGDTNLIDLARDFSDEDKAREFMERLRWPDGPVCPHCGSHEAYRLTPKPDSKKPARKGLLKCKACRKQFTVTVGTIFADSHIPISKWLLAIHLLSSSKKGMSAHQFHRMLGLSYKSAWFMAHRIRYAMGQPPLVDKLSGIVEADETYVGGKEKNKHASKRLNQGRGTVGKTAVFALVERGGRVRSFPVERVTGENLQAIMRKHVKPSARLMTDSLSVYQGLDGEYADHQAVDHSAGEYVRDDAHTNTVEGVFSLLKRGLIGTYHHVDSHHLHRYTAEFDFRYNWREVTDGTRAALAIMGAEGKRLTFRPTGQ